MKRIEDIKKFEDIDTYYEISKIVDEVFQDRVEVYKHLVIANKEIERLKSINEEHRILNGELRKELQEKENTIKEAREYITSQKLHKIQDTTGGLTYQERKLLEILDKGSNEPSFEEMVGFVEKVYKDIKSQSTLHEELEEERKTIAKIVGDFKEVNK